MLEAMNLKKMISELKISVSEMKTEENFLLSLMGTSVEENPAVSVEESAMNLRSNHKIFIVIFNHLEWFLNLKNGCPWNC